MFRVYPADSVCAAGDQMCSDSIQFRAIGVITQPLIEWVNRPTFQQADEIGPRAKIRAEPSRLNRASILIRPRTPAAY